MQHRDTFFFQIAAAYAGMLSSCHASYWPICEKSLESRTYGRWTMRVDVVLLHHAQTAKKHQLPSDIPASSKKLSPRRSDLAGSVEFGSFALFEQGLT
jgi:hypothetical protein